MEIKIPAHRTEKAPMVLVLPADSTSCKVTAGAGSRAIVCIRNVNRDFSFRFDLKKNASLTCILEQTRPGSAIYRHTCRLATGSEMRSIAIFTQCTDIRNLYHIDIQEEGSSLSLSSLAVLTGREKLAQNILCRHNAGGASSMQTFKHLLGGAAQADMVGRILVPAGSQKTEAYQQSRSILLSEQASVHVEPQLEIYADDVKCSHGSTVGQLDKDALFYMQQRGIAPEEATRMLLEAELRHELDSLPPALRRVLGAKVSRKLKHLV